MTYESTFRVCGRVRSVMPVKKVGEYDKREIIVVTSPPTANRENLVRVEAFGRDADKLAGVVEGDIIHVDGYIRGREWNGNVYCNLSADKVEIMDGVDRPAPSSDSAIACPEDPGMPF